MDHQGDATARMAAPAEIALQQQLQLHAQQLIKGQTPPSLLARIQILWLVHCCDCLIQQRTTVVDPGMPVSA